MLSCLGVIAAAVVMWLTEWPTDPPLSAGIGLFIVPRTWTLVRQASSILLKGTPSTISLARLRREFERLPRLNGVHDLHVWSLTSGVNALSAHVVASPGTNRDELLRALHGCARDSFGIAHVTIHIEVPGWERDETHL